MAKNLILDSEVISIVQGSLKQLSEKSFSTSFGKWVEKWYLCYHLRNFPLTCLKLCVEGVRIIDFYLTDQDNPNQLKCQM